MIRGRFVQSLLNGDVFEVVDNDTGILLSNLDLSDDRMPTRSLPSEFKNISVEQAANTVSVSTWLRREIERDCSLRHFALLLDYTFKPSQITEETAELAQLMSYNLPWITPALLCVLDRELWLLPAVKLCRPQYTRFFERK